MADDNDPPMLRLASSKSEADIQKQHALDALRWPTREMAANLLRVMRGHGRPHQLPQQIIDLTGLILEANELSNAWGIWSTMEEVLQSAFPSWEERDWDDRPEITAARGSLQMLASRLVYQRAQEAAGSREIHDSFREFEQKVERRRQEAAELWAAERAREWADRAARRKPRKKAKDKVRAAPKPRPAPVKAESESPADIEHTGSTAEFMKKRAEQLRQSGD